MTLTLNEWKADMIRDIFLEHEADSILSISLSTTLPGNKLVRTATANGKFSVKSAYHLAKNRDTWQRGKLRLIKHETILAKVVESKNPQQDQSF